ncbi:hypothetical protein Tco_0984129, partial [Tanacetum coccineum]
NQRKYCLELLHEYGLLVVKHVDTPLPESTALNQKESDDEHFLDNVENYQKLIVLRYLKSSPGSSIQSKKKRLSAEAEYRSMASTTCKVIWLSNLLGDMGVKDLLPIVMYCDNKKVASGVIKTGKIHTSQQIADLLTKALDIEKHKLLCEKLEMLDMFKVEKLKEGC